jgi:tetratricopeptide (TPR) repeat protein
LGQSARAIDDFSAILRLDPSRGDVLFYRGMAYQAQGDYFAAAEDLRAALASSPQAIWRRNAYRQLTTIESILADLPPRLTQQDDLLLSADTSTPP